MRQFDCSQLREAGIQQCYTAEQSSILSKDPPQQGFGKLIALAACVRMKVRCALIVTVFYLPPARTETIHERSEDL
jgi:hypothetical protein